MADFVFADKAGSSDFSATGDKSNEVFGDLLLNRTELETFLTSLRRRQRAATPPASPNTGDIWECSTTGGGYTADVVYRYNGSAWVEAVASAINVATRNTVLQGKVDANGNPDLFTGSTSALTVQLNATATPAVFAFMNGNSASQGAVDIVAAVSADSATFWSSLPTSSTVYLYVDYTIGTVSGGFTTVAPVYSYVAPAHASGKHWFDYNTGKVWSSDGSTWTQRNRIFVGTATTDGTKVTAVEIYPYNTSSIIYANDIIIKSPSVDVRAFGAKGDGVTDDTAAIQAAIDYAYANGIGSVELYKKHRVTSTITLKDGVSLFGKGETTQLYTDAVGFGPTLVYPGGSQFSLRDFSVVRNPSLTPVNGDDGIRIGFTTDFVGRGTFANLYIRNHWNGFMWRWGAYQLMENIICERNLNNGFVGIIARGTLHHCLSQGNYGHGYYIYSDGTGDTGLVFNDTGSFANQGWGFVFDAANNSIWHGNYYLNCVTSSTDGQGGFLFAKQTRQVYVNQMFIETAGFASSVYSEFTKYNGATGIDFNGDVVGADLSNVIISNCGGIGFKIYGGSHVNVSNLTVRGNGSDQVVNINSGLSITGPTGQIVVSGIHATKANYQSVESQLYGIAINTSDVKVLINGGYTEGIYNVTGTDIKIKNVVGVDL